MSLIASGKKIKILMINKFRRKILGSSNLAKSTQTAPGPDGDQSLRRTGGTRRPREPGSGAAARSLWPLHKKISKISTYINFAVPQIWQNRPRRRQDRFQPQPCPGRAVTTTLKSLAAGRLPIGSGRLAQKHRALTFFNNYTIIVYISTLSNPTHGRMTRSREPLPPPARRFSFCHHHCTSGFKST